MMAAFVWLLSAFRPAFRPGFIPYPPWQRSLTDQGTAQRCICASLRWSIRPMSISQWYGHDRPAELLTPIGDFGRGGGEPSTI
jgi:hypothetical protein